MRRLALLALLFAPAPALAADPPVQVEVDLSDVARRVVHTKLTLPATPGAMTLYYPKWIPGTHGPIGPISEQAGLRVKAGGKTLAWKRDDVDTYAFHVTVPEGATTVEATFDLVLQPAGTGSWLGLPVTAATPKLAMLNWNEVLVYPKSDKAMSLPLRATVKMPQGWKYGTALRDGTATSDRVSFPPVTLEELIDSPFLCGEYVKEVPIGPATGPKHRVVMACDSEAGLEVPPETKAAWDALVVEAGKLYGTRHYRSYTFLLTLSDQVAHFGLEHHECSDDRLPEFGLKTTADRLSSF